MKPRISVIMSVYNGERFLKESVDSILSQTFRDFEFIIINDGSSDTTEELILSYRDGRIVYVRNERNLGLIASLNKGVDKAKGDYIARMDDDDISLPDRFEKQVTFLDKHPEVSVLATRLVIINDKGFEVDAWPEDVRNTSVEAIAKTLPVTNCIAHPSVMIRTSALGKMRYNPKLKRSEDWGLWLGLLSAGHVIAKLDEVLLRYRVHAKSTTVTANQQGVASKIITFKWNYLAGKLKRLAFKKSDYRVLYSLLKDVARAILMPVIGPIVGFYRIGPFATMRQYFKVKSQLNSLSSDPGLIFIFPYYHTGGAEKVHAAIVEAAQNRKSLVFITGKSTDDAFLDDFRRHSKVIEIDRLALWGGTRPWIMNRIKQLAEQKRTTVFGCNSPVFYQLLPQLTATTRCIDLVHAFLHIGESGPEKWSLPYVDRLAARVVINQRTRYDFEKLYQAHGVAHSLAERIICIPNFTDAQPMPSKNYSAPLNLLYAGRSGEEKRVHLLAKVAAELKKRVPEAAFHFAGDVKEAIPAEYLRECVLHGNVTDPSKMKELYANAHVLLIASSREGFPMVIMEGMMMGAVPLCTDVGGIAEHVHTGINGLLVKSTDESAIVEEMITHLVDLNNSREKLKALSNAAHEYALRTFNRDNFFNSYFKLLDDEH